ncbi:MFS general substrate transporter [Dendrothele bispora CBS 962.96]|uniref:MFS general substrate transporter n=1 Tax=Dendrothele bispora (strain CBS 962.96) TaxID=1314807 RepID=A0A4V4HCG1_DENBC|nr:MFS general substrate transporter [Dendrothele bispora CBS 962.96]
MAPSLPDIAIHYDITSSTIISMTLSIFLLSFAIGPLLFGPLSEIYGRAWVLHIANLILLVTSIGCAFAPSTSSLIGLRFIAGWGGSASVAIGPSVIADIFSERDRGSAMSLLSVGPLIGPTLGPVAGGYITATIGFKWGFIVITAICGLASLIGILVLRETYAPVIRSRKGENEAIATPIGQESHWRKIYNSFSRPIILLTRSSICAMLSLYLALIYGIYYLMFATFSDLFLDTYGFGPGPAGLSYLGLGIGFIIGTFIGAKYGNLVYQYLANKHHQGKGKPELRIPFLIFSSFFVPVGLFWYGWSAQAKIHFMMPIVGTGIFGLGLVMAFVSIQLYLVDSFKFAASALAANAVSLSLAGFVFPLFAGPMFNALDIGPGNSLLAGLSILIGIPFPIYLYFNGERIRERNPLTRTTG